MEKPELVPGVKAGKKLLYLSKIYETGRKTNGQQYFSKTELTEVISDGKYRSHPRIREFLDKLEENNVLREQNEGGKSFENPTTRYFIDNDRLVEVFFHSSFMQNYLDLVVDAIDQEMEGYTVDWEFSLWQLLNKEYEIKLSRNK